MGFVAFASGADFPALPITWPGPEGLSEVSAEGAVGAVDVVCDGLDEELEALAVGASEVVGVGALVEVGAMVGVRLTAGAEET